MIEFVRQARMPGILTLPATCVASEHSAGWFAIIPSAGWSFFCLTALRVGGARGERRTDSSRGRHFPATPIPWRECSAGAGVMNRPLQHAGTTRWRSTAEQWRDPKICTFLRGSVLKIFSERRMVPIIALVSKFRGASKGGRKRDSWIFFPCNSHAVALKTKQDFEYGSCLGGKALIATAEGASAETDCLFSFDTKRSTISHSTGILCKRAAWECHQH